MPRSIRTKLHEAEFLLRRPGEQPLDSFSGNLPLGESVVRNILGGQKETPIADKAPAVCQGGDDSPPDLV
jgi:hypothetical protein